MAKEICISLLRYEFWACFLRAQCIPIHCRFLPQKDLEDLGEKIEDLEHIAWIKQLVIGIVKNV